MVMMRRVNVVVLPGSLHLVDIFKKMAEMTVTSKGDNDKETMTVTMMIVIMVTISPSMIRVRH